MYFHPQPTEKSEGTPSFLLATELSQVKLQASSSRQSAVFRSAVVSDCNSTLAGRIHNCLSTWILVQASLRGRDKGPPTVLTTQACSTHESCTSTAWSGGRREQVCGRRAEAVNATSEHRKEHRAPGRSLDMLLIKVTAHLDARGNEMTE